MAIRAQRNIVTVGGRVLVLLLALALFGSSLQAPLCAIGDLDFDAALSAVTVDVASDDDCAFCEGCAFCGSCCAPSFVPASATVLAIATPQFDLTPSHRDPFKTPHPPAEFLRPPIAA
jgi:hypothetical protein